MIDKWEENNKEYWGGVASNYSNTYIDNWSNLENEFILQRICYANRNPFTKVLDLGCGTGLGYKLCSSLNTKFSYTGIDISNEMLGVFKKNHPNIVTFNFGMSNLQQFQPKTFDFVLSIFTAFSYTDNVEKTINEISRVLDDKGTILISVISRYSMRRILNLKFGKKEKYKTRGISSNGFSYSWVFTKSELHKLFQPDFTNISIVGYNTLGGVSFFSKFPRLWKINLFVSKLFPNLSHELIITASKK